MLTFLKYDSISQSTKRKYVKIRARRGFQSLILLFLYLIYHHFNTASLCILKGGRVKLTSSFI